MGPHMKIDSIACLGAGYVGGCLSAVLASKTGVKVTVVDVDKHKIAAWNSAKPPIEEPGLQELLQVHGAYSDFAEIGEMRREDKRVCGSPFPLGPPLIRGTPSTSRSRLSSLSFSTDFESAIKGSEMIFVCVSTPMKTPSAQDGSTLDTGFLEEATRMIAKYATRDKIIVEKSTVPCKTAEMMENILEANAQPGVQFQILSNPEFLAEGAAINDLLHPDRVVIGSPRTSSGRDAAEALVEVYAQWVPLDRIITTDLWSSELSKLASNAMLAQRISSINSLSAICEGTRADIDDVARIIGSDSRIGPHMLQAGVGYGGSCFRKDICCLVYLAESLCLSEVASYWRSVIAINDFQKKRFARQIISTLFDTIKDKAIAMFGFAFKAGTLDVRDSPAISVAQTLAAEGVQVRIFDPIVSERSIRYALKDSDPFLDQSRISIHVNAYSASRDADAVVLMTETSYFVDRSAKPCANPGTGQLDWEQVARCMRKPGFIFDGRNALDAKQLRQLGLVVQGVGKPFSLT